MALREALCPEAGSHRPYHHPRSCGDTRHQQPRDPPSTLLGNHVLQPRGSPDPESQHLQLQGSFARKRTTPASIPTLALRAETCPVEGEQLCP